MDRALAVGAECFQLHLSAPQQWRSPAHSDESVAAFREAVAAAGLGPNVAHAIYLINLASPDPVLRARSTEALLETLVWSDRCGLAGSVVHLGAARGQSPEEAYSAVVHSLETVLLADVHGWLLLENSAGAGSTLGSGLLSLGAVIQDLGQDPRLGICLDTAHAFASGYDLCTDEGRARLLDEVDRGPGLGRLRAIHANDSRVPLGAAVDRHANIGEGHLGEAPFVSLLASDALMDLPWILEVPGPERQGPDASSVEQLKRLRALALAGGSAAQGLREGAAVGEPDAAQLTAAGPLAEPRP